MNSDIRNQVNEQCASIENIISVWGPYNSLEKNLQLIVCHFIIGYSLFSIRDGADNFKSEYPIQYLGDALALKRLSEIFRDRKTTSYVVDSNGDWIYSFSDAVKVYLDLADENTRNTFKTKWRIQLQSLEGS